MYMCARARACACVRACVCVYASLFLSLALPPSFPPSLAPSLAIYIYIYTFLPPKIEVDALGVITIFRGCFERCCSNKKTPPYYSNLSSVTLRNRRPTLLRAPAWG